MGKRNHILLADDNEDFLHLTATLLRRQGYQCACAQNGSMAAKLFHEETYDLLITDIKMPGNHDLKLVEDFSCSTNGAPVIVITGYPEIRSAVRAVRLPVVAYLIKPFVFNDLLTEIRRALTRATSEQTANGAAEEAFRSSFPSMNVQHFPETGSSFLLSARFVALFSELQQHLSDCLLTLQLLSETFDSSQDSSALANLKVDPPNCAVENGKDWKRTNNTDIQPSRLQTALSILTPREREVLNHLCSNQRVSIIARTLYLSPHTVRNHLKSIFRKLEVNSQVELLTWLGQDSLDP